MIRIITSIFFMVITSTASAADIPETVYDDWTVRCSETTCEMFQMVFADEEETQRALAAVVGYPEASEVSGMILVLPLGISFPSGTYVQIDDNELILVMVERCERDGCRVELLLAPTLLESLKSGSMMNVIGYDRQRRRFLIPLSLQGFAAAFKALKP